MKKSLLLACVCAASSMAGRCQVTQISPNKALQYVASIGTTKAIFASDTDNRLYVSDGTAAGTTLLSSTISFDESASLLNNKVIFRGSTSATGSELFITDGTAAGTQLLKDIYSGQTPSDIGDDMALLNGFIYFTAVSPAYGREIWKTDGTAAGTTLLKDIVPGSEGSNAASDYNLFSNGSYLLFNAGTPTSGTEVWLSNGTAAGTNLLKDINPGVAPSEAEGFFQLGGIVLFQATHASYGKEIWKTDGTAAGTVLVKDINSGPEGSADILSTYFYGFNGRAFFNATDGTTGEEVWVTDGTAANTNLLKDIEPGAGGSLNLLVTAIRVGGKFIFSSADFGGDRNQIWQSDGTPAGTSLLKDFSDGGEYPLLLPAYDPAAPFTNQPLFQGNKFFLIAAAATTGSELWVSDGTTAGTQLVKDINPGTANAFSGEFSYSYTTGAFYFAANNGTNGTELWKTNGTDAGTVMVADIRPGAAGSNPYLWPVFNNKLSFTANDGSHAAADLFVVDGNFTPLPIRLSGFTVAATAQDALLQWTTSQEINSDKFIVQRSDDGITFQSIGQVQAAGSSTGRRTYSYLDAAILNSGKPQVYYRLLLVDKDGRSEQTKVLVLKTAIKDWQVSLIRNPVQAAAELKLSGLQQPALIQLNDLNGRTLSTTTGSNGNLSIPVQQLPKGLYLLRVQQGSTTQTIRFIKE